MKVGIVTLHRVLNFGSVLQAYCTCVAVRRFGFKPEIINYMQPRHTVFGAVKLISSKIFQGASIRKQPKKIALWVLKLLSYSIQRKKFNHFIDHYLPVSPGKFISSETINNKPPQADIYLSGSDQIWNSEWNNGVDSVYFLDFVPTKAPKISYASSFGRTKIKDSEIDKTKPLLKQYSAISVREFSGVQIVSKLGISNASHVLDPTLLLSKEEWVKEFQLEGPPEVEPYLLIYSVERTLDDLVYTTARRIADSLGLRVVFLSQAAKLNSMEGCDSQRSFCSVVDFVRYLYYADFVVASSFHGIAFSINFNKQFATVLPPRFDIRLRSLLDIAGLSNRIVDPKTDLNNVFTSINYSKVNIVMDAEREKSLAFLESSLSAAAKNEVFQKQT